MTAFPRTRRNKVIRHPERGQYERAEIYQIVDEALICHVGFVQDEQPFVLPTLHARDGDTLLLHGSSASRLMKHVGAGHPVCVTVTLVDGLVLARSVFNHSINYRSAVLFGQGQLVTDPEAKLAALARFTERLLPGRWDDARLPSRKELKATAVAAIPLASAAAKVRSGPPKDEGDDLALPVWAGVVPLRQVAGDPLVDLAGLSDLPVPAYLSEYLAQHQDSRCHALEASDGE
ncbi:MAG: pyridoxamine 5'-phosphate oxidase family protein [Thermomicrobiales bacterium]|jgi:nitroimidazol reductase NimA-like FMN-containing flavoprotein (pyridoxamine 5'-phosphate oxidase superfamily)